MPRVAPSQIVQFIDRHLPTVRDAARNPTFVLDCGTHGAIVRTIAILLDALPDELLIVASPEEYVDFMFAVGALRQVLVRWESETSIAFGRPTTLSEHPVGVIRRVLNHCPDELASPVTKLAFVAQTAPDLADALLLDLGAVDRALANGEWKAATVLAASVIEALLIWALQQPARTPLVDGSKAAAKLLANASRWGCAASTPTGALEYGDLNSYLDIVEDIGGVIEPDTLALANTARNFRNLIHPGRAQRTAAQCDRGTALATVGALECVIRDLTP